MSKVRSKRRIMEIVTGVVGIVISVVAAFYGLIIMTFVAALTAAFSGGTAEPNVFNWLSITIGIISLIYIIFSILLFVKKPANKLPILIINTCLAVACAVFLLINSIEAFYLAIPFAVLTVLSVVTMCIKRTEIPGELNSVRDQIKPQQPVQLETEQSSENKEEK